MESTWCSDKKIKQTSRYRFLPRVLAVSKREISLPVHVGCNTTQAEGLGTRVGFDINTTILVSLFLGSSVFLVCPEEETWFY